MGGWRLSSERIDSKDAAMLLCGQVERGRFRHHVREQEAGE